MDLRDFSTLIIQEAWKWSLDKSPALIIYFSSIYYGRILLDEENKDIRDNIKRAIEKIQPHCEFSLGTRDFYPYISDSSFLSLSDTGKDIEYLSKNMSAWDSKYRLNIEDIMNIDSPVINIGVYGKDGHKATERVHKKYSFQYVPNLIYEVIKVSLSTN